MENMDKSFKIVLFIILAITAINFIITLFQKSQLGQIKNNITLSQTNIQDALNNLKSARDSIGAMQKDIQDFKQHIDKIQTSVEVMNVKKEIDEAKAKGEVNTKVKTLTQKRDSLLNEMNKLNAN